MSEGYGYLLVIAAAAMLLIAAIPLIIPVGLICGVLFAWIMSKRHG